MKKRLLVDMDGVLADIYSQLIHYEFKESGRRILLSDLKGLDEIVAFPNGRKHAGQRGFFRTSPLVDGACEVMRELNEVYEIFIVSAAMEFPKSLEEKFHWLQEHFSFISWKHIIFCGSKIPIRGDILIDDHFKNLDPFENRTLLYTQPHNKMYDDHGHERVRGWDDIAGLLL